jgi:uncharacterized protein (TIGR02145 family)
VLFRSDIAGKKLKAKKSWDNCEVEDDRGRLVSNCDDEFGFAALPGGSGMEGKFIEPNRWGFWWSSSQERGRSTWERGWNAWFHKISIYKNSELRDALIVLEDFFYKSYLLSVRCVKDDLAAKAIAKAAAEAKKDAEAEAEAAAEAEAE